MNCPTHPQQEAPCNDVNCNACHGADPVYKRRTLADLAREAVSVQDACNLSGVAQGFAKVMLELCELVPEGTRARNTHPITRLWVDKLASLAGCQDLGNENVMEAYREVERIMKGG